MVAYYIHLIARCTKCVNIEIQWSEAIMDAGVLVRSTAADNSVISRDCIKYETQSEKELK